MTNAPSEPQPAQTPPQPPTQAPTQTPPQAPPPSQGGNDANQMAMLAHLLGFVGGFIPSLIIWQVKKEVPFVAQEAKEALNFQITVWLLGMIFAVLALVLIGIVFLWILGLVNLVLVVIAAIRVHDGKPYRYPFCLRLVA